MKKMKSINPNLEQFFRNERIKNRNNMKLINVEQDDQQYEELIRNGEDYLKTLLENHNVTRNNKNIRFI